jgi:hypothetical protein
VRVGRLGELTGLAGAQVLLEIRLAVLPQVQEQVTLWAHWIEEYGPGTWSPEKRDYSRFGVNDLITANTEATELHADFFETGTKVIR